MEPKKQVELKVYFENKQKKTALTTYMKKIVWHALNTTLLYEEFYGKSSISLTFTDDDGIRVLNNEYRGIDSPTDVLSFPLNDFENDVFAEDETVELGDIVISLETAKRQAESYGHGFEREIAFLCVHATLHLLGYDHVTSEEDEKEMFARQDAIMGMLGLTRNGRES